MSDVKMASKFQLPRLHPDTLLHHLKIQQPKKSITQSHCKTLRVAFAGYIKNKQHLNWVTYSEADNSMLSIKKGGKIPAFCLNHIYEGIYLILDRINCLLSFWNSKILLDNLQDNVKRYSRKNIRYSQGVNFFLRNKNFKGEKPSIKIFHSSENGSLPLSKSLMVFMFCWFFMGGLIVKPYNAKLEQSAYIRRSSSAIATTPDGLILLAVNPDSNSVSLIDTVAGTLKIEIPVGIDPRTVVVDDIGSRAFVANYGGDSFSVIDLTSAKVISQIQTGHQPYGLLINPDGNCLYVAEQGADRLSVWDTNTFQQVAFFPVMSRPSGMALSSDGRSLYLTHLLTNSITVINFQPFSSYLPLIYHQSVSGNGLQILGQVEKFFHSSMITLTSKCPRSAVQDTILLYPESNLVQSIVISPQNEIAVIPHTRTNTGNRALTFDTTVFPLVSLIDLPAGQHLVGQQYDLSTLDPPGVGIPFDAAFSPDGSKLWVVNAASNDLTVIDFVARQRLAHVEVGDNPRGITISPDGSQAYVNNTLSGTVSVIDTTTFTEISTIRITELPLPPVLLNGKRLFFSSDDPRMSRSQWISCNTCHFEGEQDGRTWFFGFAGPRNTTSLSGMIETYPLRWSGEWNESADAEFAIRHENFGTGLLSDDLNCLLNPPNCVDTPPNQGCSFDLDSLATYIDSLTVPLSPNHVHGEPLNPSELRGQILFNEAAIGCLTCHPPPLYTDLKSHDVGTSTLDERIGPSFDTPSLRGLYASAPYFHDGSALSLHAALTFSSPGNEHNLSDVLSSTDLQDLITFLLALPFSN